MKANRARYGLGGNLDRYSILVLSGLIDAGFVLLWIMTQLSLNLVVLQTPLVSNLNKWIVVIFRIVFAISTLVPIALYVIRDVSIGVRKWSEIGKG